MASPSGQLRGRLRGPLPCLGERLDLSHPDADRFHDLRSARRPRDDAHVGAWDPKEVGEEIHHRLVSRTIHRRRMYAYLERRAVETRDLGLAGARLHPHGEPNGATMHLDGERAHANRNNAAEISCNKKYPAIGDMSIMPIVGMMARSGRKIGS